MLIYTYPWAEVFKCTAHSSITSLSRVMFLQKYLLRQLDHTHVWPVSPQINFKLHDDVIKWKHFPRNWPFVRGIHRSRWIPRKKGQWRGDLMIYLICVWINYWVNNREAGDLRRYRCHYDVNVKRMRHVTGRQCFETILKGENKQRNLVWCTLLQHCTIAPKSGHRMLVVSITQFWKLPSFIKWDSK